MTKKKYLTIHDKFCKASLEQRPIALDFFKAHLPQKIQKLINWETLELQSGSFIDEDYQSKYTDILYRVEMDQQPGYLFTLVEHQSQAHPLMAFRLLNYLCKIWDRHLAQEASNKTIEKTPAKDIRLPLIFPLTIYHGKVTPYPYSMDIFDLFDKKALARDILLRPFPLLDLTVISDDEILRHQHAAVMELVQKYIFQRDIMPAVKQLAQREILRLIEQMDGGHYLEKMVEYVILKGEMDSPDEVLRTIVQAVPEQEDTIMTGAEMLRQQGLQKGMQQGIHQVAKNMLAKGLDEQLVEETTGLSAEVLAQLKKESNQ